MDKNQIAVVLFDKLAERYQDKFMDVGLYHDTLDIFCNGLSKRKPEILELACGPGNITKYLLGKRPDFKIFGTDLAPRMVELAQKNNPTAEFAVFDCRDIAGLEKRYDGIMCGFCLPYLDMEAVSKLIADAADLLNDSGLLYLSTMEDDYEKSRFRKGSSGAEIFMHYYPKSFLESQLQAQGFKILQAKRQDYPETDGSSTTDLILIAQK